MQNPTGHDPSEATAVVVQIGKGAARPHADGPTRHSGKGNRTWLAWFQNYWVPILLVLTACISGGIVVAHHSDQLAPFDEWVYYDYVLKVPSQGIVRQGEFIGHDALVAMACNGDTFGPRGEPCGHVQDVHGLYPQGGKTSADIYPPVYFAITWALGKAVQFVTGAEFLTSARATGIFWLAGGLLVFYRLLELLKVRRIVSLGLGLAIIGAPTTYWSNTYISTDAPLFFVGALLLLAGVGAVRGVSSPWWLVPVAVLGVWLKVTSVLALGLVALFIILFAFFSRKSIDRRPKRALVTATIVAVASALMAEVGWLVLRSALSLGAGADQGLAQGLVWRDLVSQLAIFINPGVFSVPYDAVLRMPPGANQPLILLSILGVFGFIFTRFGSTFERALALSIVVAATIFAPLLGFAMYVVLGDVFPVLARYAIPLIPAFFVATTYLLKNQIAQWSVLVYGGLLVVTVTTCAIMFA